MGDVLLPVGSLSTAVAKDVVRFAYLPGYDGPSLDPLHLDHRGGQRVFESHHGLFRVFLDSMPGRWGRQQIQRSHPETVGLSDVSLLAWLAAGGYTSGALVCFAGAAHDESPLMAVRALDRMRTELGRIDAEADSVNALGAMLSSESLRASIVHGGARAKTTFHDVHGEVGPRGRHYLVKFNVRSDGFSSGRMEHAVATLAEKAGIGIPRTLVITFRRQGVEVGSVYLIERFDRNETGRHHRVSMYTLAGDQVAAQHEGDYRVLFDIVRKVSSNPAADCSELFRRLLFNIAINNTDDHLRNFEMILGEDGWRLSPAFDLMPNADPYTHATSIFGVPNGSLSDDFVTMAAAGAGIPEREAFRIRNEVAGSVNAWRDIFPRCRAQELEIGYFERSVTMSGKLAARNFGYGKGSVDPLLEARLQTMPNDASEAAKHRGGGRRVPKV